MARKTLIEMSSNLRLNINRYLGVLKLSQNCFLTAKIVMYDVYWLIIESVGFRRRHVKLHPPAHPCIYQRYKLNKLVGRFKTEEDTCVV